MFDPRSLIAPVLALAAVACARPASNADDPPPSPGELPRRVLRVCSDPNNLPFSNDGTGGFENRIAELIARELDADLTYVWQPQRRGALRTGVNAGACDLVMGVATELDMVLTSRPYYRSSYVFVRRSGASRIQSLDDPALGSLRVGVQLIGDDYTNSPPVHALARRGLARSVVGYMVHGDYSEDSPPADVVRAVTGGDVDIAIAWGPLAGYFAARSEVALEIDPVMPAVDAGLPMQFDISFAVKHGRHALRAELESVRIRKRAEIDAILDAHGVPRV